MASMTATQMIPAVGRIVLVAFDTLNVACEVKDVKTAWGKPRLLVSPLKGNGEQWIEMSRVDLAECRGVNWAVAESLNR